MVTLPVMEPDTWELWSVASIRRYAADMVRVAAWPPDEAEMRAATMFRSLVSSGRDTPGHEFRSIVNHGGQVVGALWFAAEEANGHGSAFIWDIFIHESERGRGYGRAAMDALEPLARSLGYDTIRLHVFGDNEIARHLYGAAGYVETDVTMSKRID